MNWAPRSQNPRILYSILIGFQEKKKQGKVYLTEESKMAVGGFAVDGHATGLNGKMTVSVVITCIVAATSGLIFGYDVGISGPFLSICFLQISY